jgi:plastocyanin
MIIHGIYFGIIIAVMMSTIMITTTFGIQTPIFATLESSTQREQPNINASSMYDTHFMVLGTNVKNLVILIPNEAHESTNQPKNQLPLANQPYLPQNAVVNVGTTVTWFNGDVDHDHTITLSGNSKMAEFNSGDFTFNTKTKPITFNDTGTLNYFETDVNNNDPNFVMNGTIDVIDQVNSLTSTIPANSSSSSSNTNTATASTEVKPDTVGTLMVPAKDLDQYISTLTSKGLNIDSTHTFKDLRGGQKGTGPEQAYIVWTSSGMNLDQVIAALEGVTTTLPYS